VTPDWSRFLGVFLGLAVVVFVVGAVASPPDPYTQLRAVVPGVVVALVVAYLVAIGGGE
jgi:Sec-independent protein secretion pathway component TatC